MEKLRLKRVASVMLPLGLLLASCGDDKVNIGDGQGNKIQVSDTQGVSAEYFDDGTRVIHMPSNFTDILQICDGVDLVEVSASFREASSIERSVNHPACVDGILTPTDFPTR